MKRYCLQFLIVWLSLVGLAACASTAPRSAGDLRRSVGAPGVVQIQDSLFMDEAEVANLHWLEYLHFIRRDSSAAFYRSQLPDSTAQPRLRPAGKAARSPADTTVATYLSHPAYRYYPVVGITYGQARNYCRWRTALVRQQLQAATLQRNSTTYYGKQHKLLVAHNVSVEYRLPTPAEWELAASQPAPATLATEPAALADINSLPANRFGIRGLSGNVAELTARPSVIKGGTWFQPNVSPRADLPNPGPRPWLGFRCVCEVQVRPKAAGR
ncbi:SUMF1/EgtB/PvdO family nonheme iron enzyme [Hymenobacter sp. BT664]|uniref:SUMF1/EgtB/PvdO family nonheme iron enzyme n=1 Tax=Hymenobacter montanus TaxID=2771359 RepID=A0A927GIS4_9BACT|nr:SUMF1/EgtB/PvdO family nonheme iron enzyme [Hymenobacter montanus]MBD2767753.1 SUMF1/EgtB/PvdO family nonheme iron enzyme [Hymenobacter montanus]